MGITNQEYFLLFALTYLLVGGLTPIMRRIAIATDVVDRPNSSHKSHKKPVPYLGGISIIIGVISISYSASLFSNFTSNTFWLATSVLGPALALGLIGLWDDVKNLASVAGVALDSFLTFTSPAYAGVKTAETAVVKGFKQYLRKHFPNVAELFFARDLTTDDFTDSQKEIMYNTIKNAMARTKQTKVGAAKYVDYGGGIEKEWFGPGGVKTSDMALNTLFSNPKFMVATTLGQFSFKNLGNKILITDTYDFKKLPDVKTTAKELEGLSYPEKIWKIKHDNNVGYYVAIRHLGYLEHPDTGLKNRPKINIELNPQDYA